MSESEYLVNWSESSTFSVHSEFSDFTMHSHSLDLEEYLQLTVMNTESQSWEIALTIDNSSFFLTLDTMTATPINQHRFKANFSYVDIVDVDSRTKILCGKPSLKTGNAFEFNLDTIIEKDKWYEVTVTFGAKHKESLSVSMKNMQERGTLTDYAIKTKEETIPCHKVVLAARSDYFYTMFTTPLKPQKDEKVLDWENVFDAATVRDLLHHIYHDSKPPNIGNTCLPLLEASHLCLLDHLKLLCIEAIVSGLTLDNVLEVLAMAEKFDCLRLTNAAVGYIVNHTNEYYGEPSKIPGWNDMELVTLKSSLYSIIKKK